MQSLKLLLEGGEGGGDRVGRGRGGVLRRWRDGGGERGERYGERVEGLEGLEEGGCGGG